MENKTITASLTVTQWNVIMSLLARGPFMEVNEIIKSLQDQASSQIGQSAPTHSPDGRELSDDERLVS